MEGGASVTGLNADQWIAVVNSRLRNYVFVAFYTVIGSIANLALILQFGPGAPLAFKCAMALSVVTVAVIAVLPSKAIFEEIAAARKDRVPQWEGTNYSEHVDKAPLTLWMSLTLLFHAAVLVVQIWAIFSV